MNQAAVTLPQAHRVDLGRFGLVCLRAAVRDLTHHLTDAEADVVSRALAARREQYSTGRWLAHQALRVLSRDQASLLRGARGEPLWGAGVVGSISHCQTMAVAAVASAGDYAGIGIDIEQAGRVDGETLPLLLTPGEQQRYRDLDPTLVFSAKEACYKAIDPVLRTYIDHLDLEIEMKAGSAQGLAFTARMAPGGDDAAVCVVSRLQGLVRREGDCWLSCALIDL